MGSRPRDVRAQTNSRGINQEDLALLHYYGRLDAESKGHDSITILQWVKVGWEGTLEGGTGMSAGRTRNFRQVPIRNDLGSPNAHGDTQSRRVVRGHSLPSRQRGLLRSADVPMRRTRAGLASELLAVPMLSTGRRGALCRLKTFAVARPRRRGLPGRHRRHALRLCATAGMRRPEDGAAGRPQSKS